MSDGPTSFHGLHVHMGNLALLSNAGERSISPENPTGDGAWLAQ